MRRPVQLCLVIACCLVRLQTDIHADEGLFFLNRLNPLTILGELDQQDKIIRRKLADVEKPRLKFESLHQIDASASVALRHHQFTVITPGVPEGYSTQTSIAHKRAYEPINPKHRLKAKHNKPLTQIDTTGYATGLQKNDGSRWWSVAVGFSQLRRRNYQSHVLTQTHHSMTAQYALFDRNFAPYILSGFIGLDGSNSGISARLTPYMRLQDGLLIGPDFQFYQDTASRKFRVGTSVARMVYKSYEAMISTGLEEDRAGGQSPYFSLAVVHRF